jgi:hypothetical protein
MSVSRRSLVAATLPDGIFDEIANLDPVYVDGMAGVTNLGTNFGTIYFRYVPVQSGNGVINYTKTPILYVVSPRASIPCSDLQRMVDAMPSPVHIGMN